MAETFKPGDTVQLKSGGPAMTVDNVDSSLGVKAVWFDGSKREDAHFEPDTLVLVEIEIEEWVHKEPLWTSQNGSSTSWTRTTSSFKKS